MVIRGESKEYSWMTNKPDQPNLWPIYSIDAVFFQNHDYIITPERIKRPSRMIKSSLLRLLEQ